MFDASSKLPMGLLSGNVLDFGHYDQCVGVENIYSTVGNFSGRHCMVKIGKESWGMQLAYLKRREMHPEESKNMPKPGPPKDLAERISRLGFLMSVCVPSSCQARDVEEHLRSHLATLLGYNISVSIAEHACNSRADPVPPMSRTMRYIMIGCVVYASIIILGTLCDLLNLTQGTLGDILRAFSLRVSWRKLVRPYSPNAEVFPVLDGLRILGSAGFLMFHQLHLFYNVAPAINLNRNTNEPYSMIGSLFKNGISALDCFLAATGFLVSYTFLSLLEKGYKINLLTFYLHRYFRLTPMVVLLIILALLEVEDPSHSAPFIKANMGLGKVNCEKNWLLSLLYLGNYLYTKDTCVPSAWSLSVDMHCYLFCPIILYALHKRPKLGEVLLGATIGIGVVVSIIGVYINELNVEARTVVGLKHEAIFFRTHMRYTPWFVGVWFGYLLLKLKNKPLPLSYRTRLLCHALAVLTVWVSTCLMEVLWDDNKHLQTALYLGLMHPLCALAFMWMVLCCLKGHGGYVNEFFSWPGFLIFSRLSFTFMLTHAGVIGAAFVTMKTVPDTTYVYMTCVYLYGFVVGFAVALLVHLCIEAPFINLEALLLRRGVAPSKKNKTEKGD